MNADYDIAEHRALHLTTTVLTPETLRLLTISPVDAWPCLGGRFSLGGFVVSTLAEVTQCIPDDLRKVINLASSQGCDYLFFYPPQPPTSTVTDIGMHVVR